MKPKFSKKEIRTTVQSAMNEALSTLEVIAPSKKTKKVISKATKQVSDIVKRDLKKQVRLEAKKKEKTLNGRSSKKVGYKSEKAEAF